MCTNVGSLQRLDVVNNSRTSCSRDAVVVCLANTAKSSNVVLDKEVLRKI